MKPTHFYKRLVLGVLVLVPSDWGLSDPKKEFINLVTLQCKLDREIAEKLANADQSENLRRFTLCKSPIIEVGADCSVTCRRKNNNIGN